MNLEERLKERAGLVGRKEKLEEEVKSVGREIAAIDEALIVEYENEGVSSKKIPGLGSFIKQERLYASILPEKKTVHIEVFKRHFPDLVVETVNGQTLSAFVREARKQGQDLPPEIEECLKTSVTKFIQWRRSI